MILQACNAACPAHFLVVVRTNDEVIPGVIAGHPHDASDFLSAGAPHVYHLLDSSGIDSSSRPVECDAAEYLDAPDFGIRRAALVAVSNVVPLRTIARSPLLEHSYRPSVLLAVRGGHSALVGKGWRGSRKAGGTRSG